MSNGKTAFQDFTSFTKQLSVHFLVSSRSLRGVPRFTERINASCSFQNRIARHSGKPAERSLALRTKLNASLLFHKLVKGSLACTPLDYRLLLPGVTTNCKPLGSISTSWWHRMRGSHHVNEAKDIYFESRCKGTGTFYTFPGGVQGTLQTTKHLSPDLQSSETKWLEPSGIPRETRTMPQEEEATSKGRPGGKASIFFFTPSCSCTILLLLTYVPLLLQCPFQIFVSFQALAPQTKILLLRDGNFSSSAKDTQPQAADSQLDQSWTLNMLWKDSSLGVRAAFSRLNLRKKAALLAKTCVFSPWRD